jgi:uncharacterized protein
MGENEYNIFCCDYTVEKTQEYLSTVVKEKYSQEQIRQILEALKMACCPVPEKVIIFVDELNKYAPSGNKESPITQQVLDVAERGRSLGVILISAQQFMSAVHSRVTGNSATKIIGRTGSSEVNAPDYRFLDQDIRMAVTRLAKGELLISHAIYRQPVKVIFPKPAYKQVQS